MKKQLKVLYKALPFKQQAFQLLKKFYKPSPNIYQHLHFEGIFRVNVDERSSFLIKHHGFQVENEIFWNGLTGG